MSKARNRPLDHAYLDARDCARNSELPTQKWVEFCRTLLDEGYSLTLYEALRTVSKYVTVNGSYKVRFSNHKPIESREANGDCDFFVGVTNLGVTNTKMALAAVRRHFGLKDYQREAVLSVPSLIRWDMGAGKAPRIAQCADEELGL